MEDELSQMEALVAQAREEAKCRPSCKTSVKPVGDRWNITHELQGFKDEISVVAKDVPAGLAGEVAYNFAARHETQRITRATAHKRRKEMVK